MNRKLISLLILFCSFNATAQRYNTEKKLREVSAKVPKEWKDLLDPKTTRFWKEGNHIPDEGFLLLAKNPRNKKYAKYWLLRNEIKANLLSIIQKTVEEAQKELFLEGKLKDRYHQFGQIKNIKEKRKYSPKVSANELKKLNYYFVFSSTCKHCKKLAKKLKHFPNVQPLQIDNNSLVNFEGLKRSNRATKDTVQNYAPNGVVPVVVIHNTIKNSATKIVGNKPIEDYLFSSMELIKEKK